MNKKVIIGIIVVIIGIGEFVFYQAEDVTVENPEEDKVIDSNIQNELNNEKQISNITNNITEGDEVIQMDNMQIKVNDKVLKVKLEKNSSVDAFIEKLKDGDIIVNAHDYGNFEKVGELGFSLPTNDTKITTQSGDLILYQGNQVSLYYDTNTWTFTKLGKVDGISEQELKDILGSGNVTLTFSLQ